MNRIVFATNNKNKLREVREMLVPLGFDIISQSEAGCDISPEENGTTFEENSAIKARAVYDVLKIPVIADDSGICVDALNDAPGVHSARYAPNGCECDKLLAEMAEVADENRGAKFVCVISFIDETGALTALRGECHGKIGYEKRGINGFGYDPVFMREGKSFAELSTDQKNEISHRAEALKQLYKLIKERY